MLKNFIFSLAEILSGTRVNSEAVSNALELMCLEFDFECGLIYEVDDSNKFCLAENCIKTDFELPKSIPVDDLVPVQKRLFAETEILFLSREENNSEYCKSLLDMYGANTLVASAVLDDAGFVYGFIFLIGITKKFPRQEDGVMVVKSAISMLVHYVSARMYKNRICSSRKTLENVLDNAGVDIYANDLESHEILYVNESMAAPYGGKKSFMGKKCWQVLYPDNVGPCKFCPKHKLVDENGIPTNTHSWNYQRPFDGSWFRVFSAAFRWEDGRMAHVVSSANISDNKRNEAIIERLANFDELTNLPNRRMLLKDCKRRVDNAADDEKGYLLFFDIDGFKFVNDNFGHDAGDEFLIKLSEFLVDIPMLKDNIYRNGGDEFVAIINGEHTSKAGIRNLSNFIHNRFKKTWQLKAGAVRCGMSIGVACYPEDGLTAEVLLQKADMAMYKVKKAGGDNVCFGFELGL